MPETTDALVIDAPQGMGTSYDTVPYSVHAFAQTRPDRLATIATLFGMNPAAPECCRVLELGCASGGNVIPMGLSWPGSHFVGIDLYERQITDGLQMVRELGLTNVELKRLNILDVDAELGKFDYILCHGVYAWVPPAVQEKILQVCRDQLNPDGVAYISYNTFPGWHARGAIREMLCYHTERFEDPADRVREARGLLAFLARAVATHDAAYNSMIRQELAVLASTPDSYLLHEHLEEYNEPLYFHQFADRAAAMRLQYLGEAQISAMLPSLLGSDIEKTVRHISADLLHMEQYMDFLRNRMFRQTLLCHDHIKLDYNLRPESVGRMHLASPAKPVSEQPDMHSDGPEEFAVGKPPAPSLSTRDPLMKAAMAHLARRWPESTRFDDLLTAASGGQPVSQEQSRKLAARMLHCYTTALVDFSLSPPRFIASVSDRPLASPYARLRARTDSKVVNMRLESMPLNEPALLVLRHLDGTNDCAALIALLANWLKKKGADEDTRAKVDEYVHELLKSFARSALLIG